MNFYNENIQISNNEMKIVIPHTKYLDNIMRKNCFIELWDLYKFSHNPAKEFTESYSAYKHLSNYKKLDFDVIHIGDGSHARTGAMFSFLTKSNNISIDPATNEERIETWMKKYNVQRLSYIKDYVENSIPKVKELATTNKVILTFVHSHVNSKEVMDLFIENGFDVIACYVSACCQKERQLTLGTQIFQDWGIQSQERFCQVYKSKTYDNKGE